jgi:hypothetical protein
MSRCDALNQGKAPGYASLPARGHEKKTHWSPAARLWLDAFEI